jgi:deoxyribonucleoside regulator
MGKAHTQLHSNQVCADLAEKLGAECLHLAAPAIARSSRSRAELVAMPGIGDTLAEGTTCDVAAVGIGGILPGSTLVEAGYFTSEQFLGLRERGIVGDVCCHFLDAEGRTRYPELSERIVGLTPDELRAIDYTIGIATGAEKARGVAAVVRGGFVEALVCDRDLARSLLEIPDQRGAE